MPSLDILDILTSRKRHIGLKGLLFFLVIAQLLVWSERILENFSIKINKIFKFARKLL